MRWLLGRRAPQEKKAAVGVSRSPPSERRGQSQADLLSAIAENKCAIEVLEKRHEHLDKKVQLLDAEARFHAKTNNQHSALFALKRKRLYMREIEQLCTARLTLDQQVQTLESAQSQRIAVQALAAGVSAQRKMNQNISIDRIDRIVDDMQEQQDQVAEVMQVFAQGCTNADDADLMRELQAMESQEFSANEGSPVLSASSLPARVEERREAAPSWVPRTEAGWGSPGGRESLTDEEQLQSLIAEMQ